MRWRWDGNDSITGRQEVGPKSSGGMVSWHISSGKIKGFKIPRNHDDYIYQALAWHCGAEMNPRFFLSRESAKRCVERWLERKRAA